MAVNHNVLPINSLNDLRPERRHNREAQMHAHKQAVDTIKSFEHYLMVALEKQQARV